MNDEDTFEGIESIGDEYQDEIAKARQQGLPQAAPQPTQLPFATNPDIAKDPFAIRKIPKSQQTVDEVLQAVVDDGSGKERPSLDDKGIAKRRLTRYFYDQLVRYNPWRLDEVPARYMNRPLVRTAVDHIKGHPEVLSKVPMEYRTKPICDYAVELEPAALQYVPEDMKTAKMCERAVARNPACAQWVKQEDVKPPAEPMTGALSGLLQHTSKTEEDTDDGTDE